MEWNVRHLGDVALVEVSGSILLGHGDAALRRGVRGLVEDGHRRILLHLGRVSDIDSAGLGELAAVYKWVKHADGELKLLAPSPKVADVLRLCRLDGIFESYEDESMALSSFAKPTTGPARPTPPCPTRG
jgi:anti-sigma B factor antagonist